MPGAAASELQRCLEHRVFSSAEISGCYIFTLEDYTAPQISRILGKNINTVYTLLIRSKQTLKEKLRYLKEHRPGLFSRLSLNGNLYNHLLEIEDTANSRLEIMMPQLAKAAGVTKQLKARD